MNTLRKKLYDYINKFNLKMNIFKFQGIIILTLAIIKVVLTSLIFILLFFAIDNFYYLINFNNSYLQYLNFLSSKTILLFLPLFIFIIFALFIEISSGKVALSNWNKIDNKGKVAKWAKYYMIYIFFVTLYSKFLLIGVSFRLLINLLNIISAILYYYFSLRLNKEENL